MPAASAATARGLCKVASGLTDCRDIPRELFGEIRRPRPPRTSLRWSHADRQLGGMGRDRRKSDASEATQVVAWAVNHPDGSVELRVTNGASRPIVYVTFHLARSNEQGKQAALWRMINVAAVLASNESRAWDHWHRAGRVTVVTTPSAQLMVMRWAWWGFESFQSSLAGPSHPGCASGSHAAPSAIPTP